MKKEQTHHLLSTTLVIASLTFILGSCSKKPIEKSYWSRNGQSLPSYSGNDQKTGIEWTVANDSTYLFFTLETHNRQVEREVMFRGVTLYLDPTGKKKKDTYFEYPYIKNPFQAFRENRSENAGQRRNRTYHPPATAYWKNGDNDMLLNSAMQHSRFSYHISIDTTGFLDYQVRIPLSMIKSIGYKGLNSTMSVGIVVQQPNMQSNFGNGFRSRGDFGGREGGRGGFRGGGRGGYGGDRRRPEGNARNRSSFQPVKVDIWFQTHLAQSS